MKYDKTTSSQKTNCQLVFWLLVVSSFNYFKMHAWYTSMLLLLHSSFMLSVVKMLLKGEVGGRALNIHGNYIGDHGKSWKNHGIVFLNCCGNPVSEMCTVCLVLEDPDHFLFNCKAYD